ncbi:right-handed parallel beta-helix repeat-containing protein [Actinokineospora inagensis]|uniref:right-handed parallel beta-helix repeat-containing protein n=1 Tax=Actinokineospora inagensis TaxID=103730 RepID=UPI0012FBC9C6|nr:right-handed parallel beta-helix repeat-containing protein [Actinokineospora inagensis]
MSARPHTSAELGKLHGLRRARKLALTTGVALGALVLAAGCKPVAGKPTPPPPHIPTTTTIEAPTSAPTGTETTTTSAPPTTTVSSATTTASGTIKPTSAKPTATQPRPPGSLPAGAVPQPGQVGYTGDRGKLKVVDGPGSAPPGTEWNSGALRFSGNVTLDGYWIKGGIEYNGKGTLTIKNSVIEGNHNSWAPVLGNAGHINISDTTVTYKDSQWPGPQWGNGAIHGDATVTVVRCDISGTPDGIQNGPGDSTIEQSYIHDLLLAGTYPNNTHNDGIQAYGGPNLVVRYNRIDISNAGKSYDGTHQNAAVFIMDSDGGSTTGLQIVGNYLDGGGYIMRVGASTRGAVITDNHFGPITGGWGETLVDDGATVSAWSNNTTSANKQINKPS